MATVAEYEIVHVVRVIWDDDDFNLWGTPESGSRREEVKNLTPREVVEVAADMDMLPRYVTELEEEDLKRAGITVRRVV